MWFGRLRRSSAPNSGANSREITLASSAPKRNEMSVPTLPNTACRAFDALPFKRTMNNMPKRSAPLKPVTAKAALFIKLGQGGEWESGCIRDGTLRLGYHEIPHDLCASSQWAKARNAFPKGSDQGAVTRHINQVRQFYEEPETTLWITFHADRMWWAFSKPGIRQLRDRSKIRKVIDKWRDTDISGMPLIKGRLSGKLLAVQSYQGTICSVAEREYLLHKINGTSEPHVAQAEMALEVLIAALVPIIKGLHPKDLEILTDLIFRQAGWQRTGVAGEVEKDIDLALQSPITEERIGVQVKSKASLSVYRGYQAKFADMRGFSRFYFVTHSADKSLQTALKDASDKSFVFWGPEQLAQQAARNGLAAWLIDKAS